MNRILRIILFLVCGYTASSQQGTVVLYFSYGSPSLSPASTQQLDSVLNSMSIDQVEKIWLDGHTDSHGSEAYNYELSKKRTTSVHQILVAKGIHTSKIITNFFGKAKPVATNNTALGRSKNRRVELTIRLLNAPLHPDENGLDPVVDLPQKDGYSTMPCEPDHILHTDKAYLYFIYNKNELLPGSKKEIQHTLELLLTKNIIQVNLSGHTDSDGSSSYNMELSQRRATVVVNYLTSIGIPKNRIQSSYYGEEQPMASNGTPEGKQKNRRVEMIMKYNDCIDTNIQEKIKKRLYEEKIRDQTLTPATIQSPLKKDLAPPASDPHLSKLTPLSTSTESTKSTHEHPKTTATTESSREENIFSIPSPTPDNKRISSSDSVSHRNTEENDETTPITKPIHLEKMMADKTSSPTDTTSTSNSISKTIPSKKNTVDEDSLVHQSSFSNYKDATSYNAVQRSDTMESDTTPNQIQRTADTAMGLYNHHSDDSSLSQSTTTPSNQYEKGNLEESTTALSNMATSAKDTESFENITPQKNDTKIISDQTHALELTSPQGDPIESSNRDSIANIKRTGTNPINSIPISTTIENSDTLSLSYNEKVLPQKKILDVTSNIIKDSTINRLSPAPVETKYVEVEEQKLFHLEVDVDKSFIDNLTLESDSSVHHSETQSFEVSAQDEIVVEGTNGTRITIPKNSLVDQDNNPVTGLVIIEMDEVQTKSQMITHSMQTTSEEKLLESGGMVNVVVTQNNEEIKLAQDAHYTIEVPTSDKKSDMMLFEGTPTSSNLVEWNQTERPPVDDSTFIANQRLMDKYVFKGRKLGWSNVDRFVSSTPKTNLRVKLGEATEASVCLVFKKLNSVINMRNRKNGEALFFNLPVGEEATLVVFLQRGNYVWYASRDIKIEKDHIEHLIPEKISASEFQTRLKELD